MPLIIFLLLITTTSYGQVGKGTISGIVKDSIGRPIEHVSVILQGTSKGAYTNSAGEYLINQVDEGRYTLVFQLLGYTSIARESEVRSNETSQLSPVILKEDIHEVEVIHLEGRNKFAKKESDHVARLPIKNLENPQVYNVVSKELMKEQVIVSFDDAVKNAPGVNRLWTSTGRSGDGAGYFSMRGFSVQPTMINGIAGLTNGGIDPANIERIESIKGPSGTLFGSSLISFGGLINIVTKKPYDQFGGEVSYTGGSYDLSRITADINTPLNKSNTALFRINGAYHYEGSFQDAGFRRSLFFAPSFSYEINKKLSFLINAEYYNSEATNPLMIFLNRTRKLIATNPDELEMNYKRSFTSDDITIKNPTLNLYGQMNYKLSGQWTSQTNISRSIRRSEGYYSYVMFIGATDTLLDRYVSDQTGSGVTTGIQQNFIGDFRFLNMRHRVVAGLDFLGIQTINNSTAYVLFDKVNSVKENDPRYGQLTQQAVDAKIATNTNPTKSGAENFTYSAYVSDVLNLTDQLITMLSLRADYFDSPGTYNFSTGIVTGKYYQAALSPKFGLVYQVVKDKVSVFGNYMNGFRNVAPVVQPLADISGTFKPQQANQLEGGIKVDLLNHKVNLTASYYDIMVNNMTRTEPIERNGNTYFITVQNGTQKSKGIEFDIITNLLTGLNMNIGYSYNESKTLKSTPALENRRPTIAGPQHLANAWISYTLHHGALKGLGIGAGGNYASENIITNNSTTGKFTLPSYVVYNASVFYQANNYRIALKADNLTNEEYWSGWSTVEPQMPRRIVANLSFKF